MSKVVRVGYNKALYILPFDHRSSFEKGLYGWSGALSSEQTERIAQTKDIIYDGFKFALGAGLAKDRAGILVDEQLARASCAMPSPTASSPRSRQKRAVRPSFNSSSARNTPHILSSFILPS
jgi:hypothetical protein